MAFSRDNKRAFISDMDGNLRIIKWQAGANSRDEFDLTEQPKRVIKRIIDSICLTKDEKYIIIGSQQLVCVYVTVTSEVIKTYKMKRHVQDIKLFKDGKKAIIASINGDLHIFDEETMQIYPIAEDVTNIARVNKIIVI